MAASNTREQSSLSSYQDARATHLHLDWNVDFARKQLSGTVTVSMLAVKDTDHVILDTNHLEIHKASVNGASAEFTLGDSVEPFGRPLTVRLPEHVKSGATFNVAVEYNTTEECAALQWLTPEQTAGKTHPYLFTQCQAIHARSLVPCQDTPFVKTTYSASVTAPKPLTAVMSALQDGETKDAGDDKRTFSFIQPVPTPSYLIALGTGNLASRDIGPRSRVWAEPCVVEDAAWEFAETEDFLRTAEDIVGPYVWGRYDLLMLPPSFPYGGMENPCLTFVTPTLIAKDRSLADVVAHEIAHSWTGNLVSPSTWNHFWINEGWTMMLQRLILSRLKGGAAMEFDSFSGAGHMQDSIEMFMSRGETEFTKLVPDLAGFDPDDAFSSVPYEKGYYLLYYLRKLVGEKNFEVFFHDYIQTFKFRSVTSEDFKNYFVAYFSEGRHTLPRVSHHGVPPVHNGSAGGADPADIPGLSVVAYEVIPVPSSGATEDALRAAKQHAIDVSSVDWDAWFYGTGMPPVRNEYDASERGKVDAHAALWVENPAKAREEAAAVTKSWAAMHWIAFMEKLIAISSDLATQEPPAVLDAAVLLAIDAQYSLSASKNAEIRMMWSQLAVRSGMEERIPDVVAFLTSQGRMKYVRPLFRELLRVSFGRNVALELFKTHGNAYHPICRKMVGVDIEKETKLPAVNPKERRKVGAAALPASTGNTTTAPVSAQPRGNDSNVQVEDVHESEDDEVEGHDDSGEEEDDDEEEAGAQAPHATQSRMLARAMGRTERRRKVRVVKAASSTASSSAPDAASKSTPFFLPPSSDPVTSASTVPPSLPSQPPVVMELFPQASTQSAASEEVDEYALALEKRELLLNVHAERKNGLSVSAALAKVKGGAAAPAEEEEDEAAGKAPAPGIGQKLHAIVHSIGDIKVPSFVAQTATLALAVGIVGAAIVGTAVYMKKATS